MKPNRAKNVLAAGNVAVGHMLMEFATHGLAQMLATADLDFVLIDMEHSPFTSQDVARLVAWFQATEIAPFVRVPMTQYHFIARSLDAGALGVMVPNVKTGAQAKEIVDCVKYAPLGERGVALGGALTGYQTVSPADFLAESNRNTTIICQIESEEGLGNLEAIASTPGTDCLWVGHFDLTNSMGIPGQFDSQRFLDALKLVVDTTRKHGLAAGIQPGNSEQAQQWMGIGYNMISYSADHALYRAAVVQGAAAMRKIATGN
ncbi:MAG: aldolase/citrate lyase family protein [Caldilineaceae bacterium]